MITEKELAARLSVSLHTVRNWRYTRQGPTPYKIGERAVRYDPDEVEEWMATRVDPFWK